MQIQTIIYLQTYKLLYMPTRLLPNHRRYVGNKLP
uniref:Uncharacterized protein n=1 Tax=virus sp. ctEQ64 TaxID=2825809 RepID=A0A8S5RLM4_9VIRU|nr:MAG TPA: hypothetical protein [virus sp. ctEQ64]